MSLVVDPFYTERKRDAVITTVRSSMEVVACEGGLLRINIVVEEDPFLLVGRPGEIVFSAVTSEAALFSQPSHFNLELTYHDDEWLNDNEF